MLNQRAKPKVAVVYTHIPHYRKPVFEELSKHAQYDFVFYSDPSGIESTIVNAELSVTRRDLKVTTIGPIMWQSGWIKLVLGREYDAYILLGNPYILSNWFLAFLAKVSGMRVLFWTHGWQKTDKGLKESIRDVFYRLSDGIMVYGPRAKRIGLRRGFSEERLHVVYNSLNYVEQSRIRASFESDAELVSCWPSRYFLSVGRLVPELELHLALEALNALGVDVKFLVVGSGPCEGALRETARRFDLDVQFLGPVYDEECLGRLFHSAIAVVSPGKVGLLAMHALAYGARVITHDDVERQMPEYESLTPNLSGVLFRAGEAIDLARAMRVCLSESSDLKHLQNVKELAVRTIEDHWTPESQVLRISHALESVLSI